jgi:hypothetical protein
MSIGRHQSPVMISETWITPKYILDALGEFDLDPCTPPEMPWETAKNRYTEIDDGLIQPWHGRVWLNPPYGRKVNAWMEKMDSHGTGTALIFARTETAFFFDSIWNSAHAIFFFKGRLHCHYVDGTRAKANAGAPSALVAYGRDDADMLEASGLDGKFILLK